MLTDDIGRDSSRGHYSIAMLAPPWAPITSDSRDVESAIGLLCTGLVERGHRVTLFAAQARSARPQCMRSRSLTGTRSRFGTV
jgi:hypothetical protein